MKRIINWLYRTKPVPLGIALAFVALAYLMGGAMGMVAVSFQWDPPCEQDEVWVVKTERCVSGTDHEAHNGGEPDEHPVTDGEREQGVIEPWHRAGTTTTTVEDPLTMAESTIERHGMSCNASVPATTDLNTLDRTCLMQLDIACNPGLFEGYASLPGFPPIQCPWPPSDPDAESPANSIPPFPSAWYHGGH